MAGGSKKRGKKSARMAAPNTRRQSSGRLIAKKTKMKKRKM